MVGRTARGWEWKTPPSYSPPTSVVAWVPNPTLKISCDKNGDIIVEPVRDIIGGTSYEFEYRIEGIGRRDGKIEFQKGVNFNLTKNIFSSLSQNDFEIIMQDGLRSNLPRHKPQRPPQLFVWLSGKGVKIDPDKSYSKVQQNYFFKIKPTKGQFIRNDKREVLYEISSEISLGSKKENMSMQFNQRRFNSRFTCDPLNTSNSRNMNFIGLI